VKNLNTLKGEKVMKKNILAILTIVVLAGLATSMLAGTRLGHDPGSMGKIEIGLLSFTGQTSGVNQNSIRGSIGEKLNAKGFSSANVSSSETKKGRFQYFIGVEIQRPSKSEIVVNVTLYGQNMNVIKQTSVSRGGVIDDSVRTVDGVPDDGVRPMVLKGLGDLISQIR
jgi:hypothetical protein